MQDIRVGVIGGGQNARKTHIPNLQAIPGVTIREIANRTAGSARKTAAEFNIPVVKADWREVAASRDIDAVVIGTWPYLHCEATCLALSSGKHVLCEARMAMNAAEAEAMLQTAQQHPHLTAQLVPSPFTLKVDAAVTRYLDEKRLGRLLYFHFDCQSGSLAGPTTHLHWRRNKRYSGVNAMMLGIAYESILRWLGPAAKVSAHSRVFNDTAINPETGQAEKILVPDYLSAQVEMANGMSGSFLLSEAGLHAPPPAVHIFGAEGTLSYRFAVDGDLRFGARGEPGTQTIAIPENERGRWRVEEEFINAIRGQEKIRYTTFATGLAYMRFTEAVMQSCARDGERIRL